MSDIISGCDLYNIICAGVFLCSKVFFFPLKKLAYYNSKENFILKKSNSLWAKFEGVSFNT